MKNIKAFTDSPLHRLRPSALALLLVAGAAGAQTGAETATVGGHAGGGAAAAPGASGRQSPLVKMAQKQDASASAKREAPQQQRTQTMAGPKCVGGVGSPEKFDLKAGKSTLLRIPKPVSYRTVGNPDIVQAVLVPPDGLYLLGLATGTTNMIIQDASGACHAIDIIVRMDPSALEATLSELMPKGSNIKVTAVANSLVMSGEVEDALAVNRAVELADAYTRKQSSGSVVNVGEGPVAPQLQERVINLLAVRSPQQVMLEVKVAEVSKTLLDRLGFSNVLQGASGSWTSSLLTNFITGTAGGILDATKSNGNSITLEAEKRDGLIRILAEPTLMAISGQEGRFLAGGTIFVPVANRDGEIRLEEKDFGVKLTFTPTVLAGERINLKVHPEVSELSREGIGISTAGFVGRAILPLITKRNASTTVQLKDGQSFAIGGLIKSNTTTNIKALPVLGEVPVLGALFRSTDFQEDRSELLFVVTPRLVKPLPPNYALPTDSVVPADRTELFLGGQMESSRSSDPTRPQAAPPPVQAVPPSSQLSPPQGRDTAAGPSGFDFK